MLFLSSKKRSPTPISRLPLHNISCPTVYSSNTITTVHPHISRSSGYYDHHSTSSPARPTPSWTSEMSVLADKIRHSSCCSSPNGKDLDRKSISQGMKLVAIAADEYQDGNRTVALDIYLSGIDKILMALPNKTDPKTKMALREKLTSVQERVGILSMATQHRQQQNSLDQHRPLFPFSLSNIIHHRSQDTPSTIIASSHDPVARFKRFAQFVINATVACAVLIKQSPLPDIAYFIFGYFIQLLLWIDSQYHVARKAQDAGIECVKLLLQADEQYHLHELATEAMYMFIAAGLKAAIAYKEAPGYRPSSRIQYCDEDDPPCPPKSARIW